MSTLFLRLFGTPHLFEDSVILDIKSRKGMAILAYLAVNGRSSRDTLATLLWPEHDQQGARNNLRRTLFKLKKTAVSQWLRAENEWVELAANGRIDLHQFQAHLEANERQQAVDLYRGDFLADFFLPNNSEFEAWAHSQRERLRQQVFGLLDTLIQDGLDRGAYKTAEKQARRQLEIDDLYEPAYQQLMLALAKQGQRSAALAAYERCQAHFEAELGIAPSRQTTLLFQQIEAEQIRPGIQQQLAVQEEGVETAVSTPIKRDPALAILLAKVKSFWVEGMLEHAVANETLLPLAKETVPEGIANPWQTVVQPDPTRQAIGAEEPIEALFAASGHALLILGAPGAGKTTILLDLARVTIVQAENDPKRPIPVVFNLASWPTKAEPLANWLVQELNEKYLIPKRLGQSWVATDQLLLLLDGLNEMAADRQTSCSNAINDFRQQQGLTQIAVCCRAQEYAEMGVPLRLGNAIRLLPLALAQSTAYLAEGGTQLNAIRDTIAQDRVLREVAQSPLMLKAMREAFVERETAVSLTNLQAKQREEIHEAIFTTYVSRMLQQLAASTSYSTEQGKAWLAWLAQGLGQHNQSHLFVERLQPSWLTKQGQRFSYLLLTRLVLGCLFDFLLWLLAHAAGSLGSFELPNLAFVLAERSALSVGTANLFRSLAFSPLYGLGLAIVDFFFFEQRRTGQLAPAANPFDGSRKLAGAGMITAVSFLPQLLVGESLQYAGLLTISNVVFLLLLAHFVFGTRYGNDVRAVELLGWSWQAAAQGALLGGVLSVLFLPVVWLFFQQTTPLDVIWPIVLIGAIAIFAPLSGFTAQRVATRTYANQGMWLAARNGGLALVLVAIVLGVGLLGLNRFVLENGRFISANAVITFAAAAGLAFGGFNLVNHWVLRGLLWRNGRLPLQLIPFLDHATRHSLLHRVGGGYLFIHPLLQAHFAARTKEPRKPDRSKKTCQV